MQFWSLARVALVGALVLVSGCVAPFGVSGSQSPTASPEPVTPPGVVNGTLENESALLTAHTTALGTRGFRLAASGTESRTVYAAAANYSIRRVIPGPNASNPAIWSNGTVAYAQFTRDGETFYETPPRGWIQPHWMTGAELIGDMLETATYTRNGSTECGARSCAILVATNSSAFENFTARMLVDESGVVHRFDVTAVRNGQEPAAGDELHIDVTRLGNVTVSRPPWLDDAIAGHR